MLVFEQVFIRANRSFLAVAFLNDGAVWSFWFRWRISAAAGYGLDEKRFAVGHPLQGIAEDGTDFEALKLLGLGGFNIADPQLYGVGNGVGKGEFGTVRRPVWHAEIRIGGETCDLARLARRNLNQTQGDKAWRMMSAVGRRVDTQSSNAKHGLREIGYRRVRKPVDREQPFSIWI